MGLVAVPFFAGDEPLAAKNLEWCIELDGAVNHACLLSFDSKAPANRVRELAGRYFRGGVHEVIYPPPQNTAWPFAPNYVWQQTAMEVFRCYREPWFFWEADATPLRTGWLDELWSEYKTCGKPFMGHIVEGMGHCNGVAIYPVSVVSYCSDVMLATNAAWDIVLKRSTVEKGLVHNANHLIAHKLNEHKRDATGAVTIITATFKSKAEVDDLISNGQVLFHGCKNGSLIDVLRNGVPKSGLRRLGTVLTDLIHKKPARRGVTTIKLWHVVQRFPQRDAEAHRRVQFAFNSWVRCYSADVRPVHVWECPRHSGAIGDKRNLPYLKDVLQTGLGQAGGADAIMFTNDDTVLHPDIIPAIQERLGRQPAFCSFRLNYHAGHTPNLAAPFTARQTAKDDDIGRDVFVFTVEWLRRHWDNIPDFCLGELEWDLILAMLIRKSYGLPCSGKTIGQVQPVCEFQKGYVWHERHVRAWVNSGFYNPAKQHNWKLSADWCAANGITYPFE